MNNKRPILPNLVNSGTIEIEKFQNEVIRPVIKMQHSVILSLFNNYLKKRKIDFKSLSLEKQHEKIKLILTKDNTFKYIFLGIVIGHFSIDELNYYHLNASELNRRVFQISIQRLKDSISLM